MRKFYVLSDRAIRILKMAGVKGQILDLFGLNDPRTIDKYIAKMYPDNPLLNRNVLQIIKDNSCITKDDEILRLAEPEELQAWRNEREEIKMRKRKKI